jgi:RNA polymerase sigma-70 factor (ECF subfamily)
MHEDCKEYFEKISEYLDGELDGTLCEKIEHHLQDCPECRECIDSLKKTIRLCRDLPRKKIPRDAQIRLRDALKKVFETEIR